MWKEGGRGCSVRHLGPGLAEVVGITGAHGGHEAYLLRCSACLEEGWVDALERYALRWWEQLCGKQCI